VGEQVLRRGEALESHGGVAMARSHRAQTLRQSGRRADGSAEVESRDSRQKTRIAYMQCTSRALPREDPRPADLYADLHVSVQAHQRKLPLLALTAAVQYYPLRDCTCGISYGQERTRVAGIHSLNPPRFVNFPGSSLPQLIFP
jgi:hypothetical protein